jgi:hypothetical protein
MVVDAAAGVLLFAVLAGITGCAVIQQYQPEHGSNEHADSIVLEQWPQTQGR